MENIKVYQYHPITKVYVGETEAYPCPIEGKTKGVYHYPGSTTDLAPPEAVEGKAILFDEKNNAWVYKSIPKEAKKPEQPTEIDYKAHRNALLNASDIPMLIDNYSKLTDDQKKQWIEYRQYLRDLPTKPEFTKPETWLNAPVNK